MRVIGFGGTFYTLWEVSDPYKVWSGPHSFYMCVEHMYIKNLSKSLERAKAKCAEGVAVDEDLKGSTTWTDRSALTYEEGYFSFGKYAGTLVAECTDYPYLAWVQSTGQDVAEEAKKVLMEAGCILYKGLYQTPEAIKQLKAEARKDAQARKNAGHHGVDGDRVELEIMETDGFSFLGNYGTTYVRTYKARGGKVYKYMGGSPPDISRSKYTKVLTSLSHDEYQGVKETKIKRTKVL